MRLTYRHRAFCSEYVACGIGVEAYQKAFKNKNYNSARTLASQLLKNPEIAAHIDKVKRDKETHLIELRKEELEQLGKNILTEIELDFFHSEVVRGNVQVKEIIPIREYVALQKDSAGNIVPGTGKWTVSFKEVKRPANIVEKQRSAAELYKRKGSYAKIIPLDPGEGNPGINGDKETKSFILLSDGSQVEIE